MSLPSDQPESQPEPDQQAPATIQRNFWTMVAYQVLLRIGWIFKTETVVMPSFLDFLGGSGWVRGLLPIFNRFGQCVPPMIASDWVGNQRQKKTILACTTLVMATCFLSIAGGYALYSWGNSSLGNSSLADSSLGGPTPSDQPGNQWMPWLFIAVYAIFFSSFGVNQLVQNTLQGKIIPVQQRGRLMTWGSLLGVVFAVTAAVSLLPRLLNPAVAAFELIFAFTGTAFLLAALMATRFVEENDQPEKHVYSLRQTLRLSLAVIATDPRFRRYAIVVTAFGLNMVLFPHYQALAKQSSETNLQWLLPWLVAQNLGAAFFSTVTGRIADRVGNAVAIRLLMAIHVVIPVLSLTSAALGADMKWSTIVVFFVLGATPVTYRLVSNFTLELVPRPLHPRYLSSLAICLALPPMLLSLPTGILIDWLGFLPVFLSVSGIFLLGLIVMLNVEEPRNPGSAENKKAD